MARIAIIGAGVAGLSTAQLLSGHDVVVFEKSWRPGGRVTSRTYDECTFDHGAQFFTVRTPAFSEFISPLVQAKVIEPWQARFVEIENNQVISSRQWSKDPAHYVGVPTMSEIGQYLARDLNVHYNIKIDCLDDSPEGWRLTDQSGGSYAGFDWVTLALPAFQAKELIQDHMPEWSALSAVNMQGCYSYMLGFDQEIDLGFEAALVKKKNISWISVNRSKPGREGKTTLLVHSTNRWADGHMGLHLDEVKSVLRRELESIIDIPKPIFEDIHRWRFANHQKHAMQTFVDPKKRLAVCGDWCHQGRIEAAFLSSKNTVQVMGI